MQCIASSCSKEEENYHESDENTTDYKRQRYYHRHRVMVSAPTNKAILVLAEKMISALEDVSCKTPSLNIILIGVQDKLLPLDENDDVKAPRYTTVQHQSSSCADSDYTIDNKWESYMHSTSIPTAKTTIRSIFLYKWLDEMIHKLHDIQKELLSIIAAPKEVLIDRTSSLLLFRHIYKLIQKLTNSIPNSCHCSGCNDSIQQLLDILIKASDEALSYSTQALPYPQYQLYLKEMNDCLTTLLTNLSTMDSSSSISELVSTADVLFCTLTTAGSSLLKQTRSIDDLFIDEGAACTESELCIPFHLRPQRMMVVGDPMQLPSTVMSQHAVKLGFDKSLQDRLMNDCSYDHVVLDVQYRMKPDISTFPSKQFYKGKIMDGDNVTRTSYKSKNPNIQILNGMPYSFIQVMGFEKQSSRGSYYNNEEANVVVQLVQMVRDASKKNRKSINGDAGITSNNTGKRFGKQPRLRCWDHPEKIRIITFYQGQVTAIKQKLREARIYNVLVATVDSSQGCEADIVILSFVRSKSSGSSDTIHYCNGKHKQKQLHQYGGGGVGFLSDVRRLNVALTRAKYQLVCVGNVEHTLLNQQPSGNGCNSNRDGNALRYMSIDARKRGVILTLQDLASHK